jgi:hypothetical protein
MVPRMCTPPLKSLPSIRVNTRRAVCRLTPGTTWGSSTGLVVAVVLPETNDQLHRPTPADAAPGTRAYSRWRWRQLAAPPSRTHAVPAITSWRQHHDDGA